MCTTASLPTLTKLPIVTNVDHSLEEVRISLLPDNDGNYIIPISCVQVHGINDPLVFDSSLLFIAAIIIPYLSS